MMRQVRNAVLMRSSWQERLRPARRRLMVAFDGADCYPYGRDGNPTVPDGRDQLCVRGWALEGDQNCLTLHTSTHVSPAPRALTVQSAQYLLQGTLICCLGHGCTGMYQLTSGISW